MSVFRSVIGIDLFEGYKETVPGNNVEKRRAETFYKHNLRQWMQCIADKAIIAAKKMESDNV